MNLANDSASNSGHKTILKQLPESLVPEAATKAWSALDSELKNQRLVRKRKREVDFENEFAHLHQKVKLALEEQKAVLEQGKNQEALLKAQQEKALLEKKLAEERLERERKYAKDKEELALKEQREKKAQENDAAKKVHHDRKYVSPLALESAQKYLCVLEEYKKTVLSILSKDKPLFQFCFLKKMSVRVKVGQVSNLKHVFIEKAELISNELVASQKKSLHAYQWLLNYTAKQILDQAQSEAALNRAIALALGHVVLLLIARHPDFTAYFMGRLYKRCLVAIPQFIEHKSDMSDSDFFLAQRYKQLENKSFEDDEKYGERNAGMIAVFASVLSCGSTSAPVPTELQPLLWKWPARLLNLPPRRLTPVVLLAFLEIAGGMLTRTYRKQAEKMLDYILETYLPKCPKSAVAATTRCKLWLEKNWQHAPTTFGKKNLPFHPDFKAI